MLTCKQAAYIMGTTGQFWATVALLLVQAAALAVVLLDIFVWRAVP